MFPLSSTQLALNFFIQSVNLCLLTGVLRPFILNLIIDTVGFNSIVLLFSLYSMFSFLPFLDYFLYPIFSYFGGLLQSYNSIFFTVYFQVLEYLSSTCHHLTLSTLDPLYLQIWNPWTCRVDYYTSFYIRIAHQWILISEGGHRTNPREYVQMTAIFYHLQYKTFTTKYFHFLPLASVLLPHVL